MDTRAKRVETSGQFFFFFFPFLKEGRGGREKRFDRFIEAYSCAFAADLYEASILSLHFLARGLVRMLINIFV